MADITFDFEVKPIIFDLTFNTSSGGGGIGTVTSVAVGSPLSSALTFNTPTTTPSLVIQNASAPGTQFLRGDGLWAVPPGSGGTGTITSITASTGLSGGVITTSGTIALLPAVGSTTIGGVKAGTNIAIAADGTISSTGSGTGGISALTAGVGLGAPTTGVIITTTGTINLLAPTASIIGGVKAGTNITIALDGTISATQITPPSPATVAPLPDGTGAIGTSVLYARQDHVHPFALTTVGTTGAATYSAQTGALNIPSYSGGGGGGGGFSWSSVANIAVNDVFFASSPVNVVPGTTQAFDGTALANTSSWDEISLPWTGLSTAGQTNIGGNGNNLVLFNSDIQRAFSSIDNGFSWRSAAITFSAGGSVTLGAIAGIGSTFITVDGSGFQRSADAGLTWASVSVPGFTPLRVYTFGTTFYAFGSGGGIPTLYTSTNGSDWTVSGSPTFASINFQSIVFNGTTILICAISSSDLVFSYSDDLGVSWTAGGTISSFGTFNSMLWDTARFVVITTLRSYSSTNKGVAWALGASSPYGGRFLTNVNAVGSRIYGVLEGNGAVLTSIDSAVSWQEGTTLPGVFGQGMNAVMNVFLVNGSAYVTNPTRVVLRASGQNSLLVYSPASPTPIAAPNGTYRALGSTSSSVSTDSLWIRTA